MTVEKVFARGDKKRITAEYLSSLPTGHSWEEANIELGRRLNISKNAAKQHYRSAVDNGLMEPSWVSSDPKLSQKRLINGEDTKQSKCAAIMASLEPGHDFEEAARKIQEVCGLKTIIEARNYYRYAVKNNHVPGFVASHKVRVPKLNAKKRVERHTVQNTNPSFTQKLANKASNLDKIKAIAAKRAEAQKISAFQVGTGFQTKDEEDTPISDVA